MFYDLSTTLKTVVCNEIDKAIEDVSCDNVFIEISQMLFAFILKRVDFNPLTYNSASSRKIKVVIKENTAPELTFSVIESD